MIKNLRSLVFFSLLLLLICLLLIFQTYSDRYTNIGLVTCFVFVISFIYLLIVTRIYLPKKIIIFAILFLIINLLLLPFSSLISPSLHEFTLWCSYLGVFFLSYNLGQQINQPRLWSYFLSGLGLFIFGFGIWQHFEKGIINISRFHLIYPFGWDNLAAGFYLLLIPVSLVSIYINKGVFKKTIAVIVASVFIGAFILTYSRGAWLSLLFTPLVLLLFTEWKNRPRIILKNIFIYFLILLGFMLLVFLARDKLLSLLGISFGWRISIFSTAWQMFRNNWLTGVGLGNFGGAFPRFQKDPWVYSRFSHDYLLQIASETGIFGLLSFILIWFVILTKSKQLFNRQINIDRETKLFSYALFASIMASLLHNLIDVDWNYPYLTILLCLEIGLLIALVDKTTKVSTIISKKARFVLLIISLFLAGWSFFLLNINNNYLLAQQQLKAGQIESGKKLLDNLIKRYPIDGNFYIWLGAVYNTQGLTDKAKNEYLQAQKLDSFTTEPAFNLALIAIKEKNFNQADMYFKQIITLNPYLTLTYYRVYAQFLIGQRKTKEAQIILTTALEKRFPLNDYFQSYEYMYPYPDIFQELTLTTNIELSLLQYEGRVKEAQVLQDNFKKAKIKQQQLKKQ